MKFRWWNYQLIEVKCGCMTDRQMDTDNYRAGHLASCKTLIIFPSENKCWRTIAEASPLFSYNITSTKSNMFITSVHLGKYSRHYNTLWVLNSRQTWLYRSLSPCRSPSPILILNIVITPFLLFNLEHWHITCHAWTTYLYIHTQRICELEYQNFLIHLQGF